MTRAREIVRTSVMVVALCIGLGGCSTPVREICDSTTGQRLRIHLPLQTQGARIVDAHGQRVRLQSINWFGAESGEFVVGGLDRQSLASIVKLIRDGGFNSVRLPWSNEMIRRNPVVENRYLSANPRLQNRTALEIFDAVIDEIGRAGLLVVLDNHRSRGDWCCDETHGDGLWHTKEYPESAWLADWQTLARRYVSREHVIAAELRNEIRADPAMELRPSWGDGNPTTDWRAAAQRGGNAVLEIAPRWLIVVGGIDYQEHLAGVRTAAVEFNVANRLVYAAHDYAWWHASEELSDDAAFATAVRRRWDYVRDPTEAFAAPVYISEWGGCVQRDAAGESCAEDRAAFVAAFARYANDSGIDWAYWPLNGTQSSGYNRTRGAVETYGLLNPEWSDYANREVLRLLTAQCAR